MRVTVRNGNVISDTFQDNIMKDCGVEDVLLLGGGGISLSLKDVIEELEAERLNLYYAVATDSFIIY